jgi:hypothetical protein
MGDHKRRKLGLTAKYGPKVYKVQELCLYLPRDQYEAARTLFEEVEADLAVAGHPVPTFREFLSVCMLQGLAAVALSRQPAEQSAEPALVQPVTHIPAGMAEAADRLRGLKGK